jgi:hypothetical protein
MMFDSLPPQPPAIVQVAQNNPLSEDFDVTARWDLSGWMFLVPTLPGDQPYVDDNPLIVLDAEGNEVVVEENSYKVPGLLRYKNPEYYIIIDQEAFAASGYRMALKAGVENVQVGIASYTSDSETLNRFELTNSSPTPQILSFEKIAPENTLQVGGAKMLSLKTESRSTLDDDLTVQAEVSSDELIIPKKPTIDFSDIKSPLLKEAVAYLVEREIVSGFPDGTFQPDRVINRAEALKIIFEATGMLAVIPGSEWESASDKLFKDVETAEWYSPYVIAAQFHGIIQGYPDGTYRPTSEVNKAEFLKIALSAQRSYETPSSYSSALAQFSDLDKSQWYMPFVTYAVEHGYLDKTTKLKPTEGMTRGEAAMIIYRILKEQE